MTSHYIDAAAFTRLFRRRNVNFQKICISLESIVAGVIGRFHFNSSHDREDVKSRMVLHVIERIDRFKFSRGDDAFDYYTKVCFMWMRNFRRRAQAGRPGPVSFTDLRDRRSRREFAAVLESSTPYSQVCT